MSNRQIYHTTYCNFGHYLDTGKPVDHECITIPPEALQLEREGDFEAAINILSARRRA